MSAAVRLLLAILTVAALLGSSTSHASPTAPALAGLSVDLDHDAGERGSTDAHCHCVKTSRLPEQIRLHERTPTGAAFDLDREQLNPGRSPAPPLKPPRT